MSLNLLGYLTLNSLSRCVLQNSKILPTRFMSKKKQPNKDGNCQKSNDKCGDNQFFGGCFKKEEDFKCNPKRKEKGKGCHDPCKDGPCKQRRD